MPRLPARPACFVALAALCAVGCFGFTHNPGTFPNLIPPGDIIQTHAKPPGGAYFRDFDSNAYKIEVTPPTANANLGGQQVFLATVVDKDGVARRGRRVEWMIDGPGHIVEVDESGWTPGRGYKVSDKYGVGYTTLIEHKFTRGTNTSADDFTIQPGQTWCVVTSAVPGETVVTAYAPGVFNWEKGRTTAKVTWGNGNGIFGGLASGGGAGTNEGRLGSSSSNRYEFPPPTSARFGGQASLNTYIRNIAAKQGIDPSELWVRYRIAGGTPANLIAPPSVSGARPGEDYLEIPADSEGKAPVRVAQSDRNPRPGKTDIAIEVLRFDGASSKVVSRSSTSVEWTAPKLALEIQAPRTLGLQKEGIATLIVSNASLVDGSPSRVDLRFQEGFEIGNPDPAPNLNRDQLQMAWSVPALAAGEKREFRIPIRSSQNGSLKIDARALGEDQLTASARATVEVGTSSMKISTDPTYRAILSDKVPVKITVTNPSKVPLDTATAYLDFGTGLEHASGTDPVEATIGIVGAGESKSIVVPLLAKKPGASKVRIRVKSSELVEETETTIEVRTMEMAVTITGPDRLTPGSLETYEFGVSNRGDTAVPNANLSVKLPTGVSTKQASDGGSITGPGTAVWRIGELPANGSKIVRLQVSADRPLDKGAIQAVAMNGDVTTSNLAKKSSEGAATAKTDKTITVAGQPVLMLQLDQPIEAVPVGRRAGYRVTVKNQGTGPAKDVKVTVILPPEYSNAFGTGPNKEDVKPEGTKLYFPVIANIPANGSASFYVEVQGAQAGDARVRAEVLASYLTKPLSEEQSTRVVDKAK